MDTTYSYVVYRPNPYIFPSLTFAKIPDGDMMGTFYPVALGQHCYGFSQDGTLLTVYDVSEVEYSNGVRSYEWIAVDLPSDEMIAIETDIRNSELAPIFNPQKRVVTSSVPARKMTTLDRNISYTPLGHGKPSKFSTNSLPRATRSSVPIEAVVSTQPPTELRVSTMQQ